MARKKDSGRKRGADRMKEQGYKLVAVWLDETEHYLISRVAQEHGKKLATWLRETAYLAARDGGVEVLIKCGACGTDYDAAKRARCWVCGHMPLPPARA